MKSIVIDTNVIYAGLRSNKGASFRLLKLFGSKEFTLNISVPLIIEYEDVLHRSKFSYLSNEDIKEFINYICKIALKHKIFFLWRPFLKDPKDDMILELAVVSNSDYIITYNLKDFNGINKFGIEAITPQKFLNILEANK